jgi:hypothetical protein
MYFTCINLFFEILNPHLEVLNYITTKPFKHSIMPSGLADQIDPKSIVTDWISALPGKGSVNTIQHATIYEVVFSMSDQSTRSLTRDPCFLWGPCRRIIRGSGTTENSLQEGWVVIFGMCNSVKTFSRLSHCLGLLSSNDRCKHI